MEESFNDLESLHNKAKSLLVIILVASAAFTIIILIVLAALGVTQGILFLTVLLSICFSLLLAKVTGFFQVNKDYRANFKATLIEVPFRNAFTQVIYNGKEGIDQEVIRKTGIMTLGNRYHSNDYVQGYYRDVRFERSDVKIQQHVSTGKTSYTITYLHGRWLIFEFNKDFHFDMQIISKEFSASQKKNSIFTGSEERRHRIELEDIDFNENFQVFCQDEHEAYYILTPRFMQILKDLNTSMDGSFMLGFVDNQLHVAVHNSKDAMEPKLFDDLDLGAIKAEVQKEINVIIDIIEGLALDRNIFKQEGEK
jgi:hypothetical protein